MGVNITIGQIVDVLQWEMPDKTITIHVKEQHVFRSVKPLITCQRLEPGFAYICDAEEFYALEAKADSYKDMLFIFGNAQKISAEDIYRISMSAIFVSDIDPIELLDKIHSAQLFLCDWDETLSNCLISGASFQEILDKSQHVLINPIIILDSSMSVLAYSKNIADDDEHFYRTITLGYTPTDIIEQMIQKGYDQYIRRNTETICRNTDCISPYTEIFSHVVHEGAVVAGMIMHCSERDASQGLMDTLGHFSQRLTLHFRIAQMISFDPSAKNYKYEKYMRYLIEGRDMEEDTARSMSESVSFPFEAIFNLFVFTGMNNLPPKYALTQVMESIPDAQCILYEGNIVSVTAFKSKYRSESEYSEYNEALLQTLDRLTDDLRCYCGFSWRFYSPLKLKTAYTQAKTAAELCMRFIAGKNYYNTFHLSGKPRKKVCLYDDIYLHHMAKCCSERVTLDSMCVPELMNLLEHDRKNNSGNYKILYIYLESNRNATAAAKILHMHRNNVNYRIKRIKELFGLDVVDPKMRLKIQMSFRILDLL